jgi:hypothetical protein
MTSHPNFDRTQAALDAARQGDYVPAFDAFTDDVLLENGPGAGPWHRARGNPHPVASPQRLPAREATPELAVLCCSAAANSTKAHSAESALYG